MGLPSDVFPEICLWLYWVVHLEHCQFNLTSKKKKKKTYTWATLHNSYGVDFVSTLRLRVYLV